jgi:hypothetical protein
LSDDLKAAGCPPFSETDSLSISSSPHEVHSGVDLISSSELDTPKGRPELIPPRLLVVEE